MAIARLQSFRRVELIDATIAAIFAGGFQQTTLNAIGMQAELSLTRRAKRAGRRS